MEKPKTDPPSLKLRRGEPVAPELPEGAKADDEARRKRWRRRRRTAWMALALFHKGRQP